MLEGHQPQVKHHALSLANNNSSNNNNNNNNNNHRLNGSSSPVLTATPRSCGKGQNSTPYKIKPPERIGIKFGTVDYILEICPQNKFGDDRSSAGFMGKYVKYTMFVTFFFPQPTWRPHLPTNFFTQNGLNDVVPRTDVPFAVKSKFFLTTEHQAPNTAKISHFWGGTENFRSISPLTLAVS